MEWNSAVDVALHAATRWWQYSIIRPFAAYYTVVAVYCM